MNSGFYAACTALMSRDESLQVAANNLANVNTTGFRGQGQQFRSLVADDEDNSGSISPMNRAINDYGILGGTFVSSASGRLEHTGNPLDLGLQGPGFFVAKTAEGLRYTRNGNFRVDTTGTLLSSAGDPVLDDRGQPIKLPSGTVTVSSDGTISVAGATVDKLRLVEIDSKSLTARGQYLFPGCGHGGEARHLDPRSAGNAGKFQRRARGCVRGLGQSAASSGSAAAHHSRDLRHFRRHGSTGIAHPQVKTRGDTRCFELYIPPPRA